MNVPLVPEGVFSSVRLHLLETLSHVNDVFVWPVNPSVFLFLHFLNVVNWRLCFPSMGIERREMLLCPHCIFIGPYVFLSSAFFFWFCFSFSSSSSPPFFLLGFWQFAFPGVEVWPHCF